MAISVTDVKDLRERTGAGMMDCKKALIETKGNREAAVDFLRAKGLARAAHKASRIAAEGLIGVKINDQAGVLVEINCETDFVAKGDHFKNFVEQVVNKALDHTPQNIMSLKELTKDAATELTLKCGEKVDVRRYERMPLNQPGLIGHYSHGGKIGVLVEVKTNKDVTKNPAAQQLVKEIAMHVAASDPKFVNAHDIDKDFKKREADIYTAQLKEQGKPDKMISQIVEGKLKKLAREVCLLEQKFVKNPDISVQKYVQEKAKEIGTDANIISFLKLNLGKGIQKKSDNLFEEVAKMTGR